MNETEQIKELSAEEQIKDLSAEIYDMAESTLAFGEEFTIASYFDVKRIASKIIELVEQQLEPPF